jgi:hypothetical protein
VPAVGFPQRNLASLHELAARLLDSRKSGTAPETFARELLVGFYDVCARSGLDRVLADLEQAFPPLDVTDRFGLAEHPELRPSLVAKLESTLDLDDGGPRNARPRQLADCLIAALSLTVTDEPERTITLGDDIRAAVVAALASVVDVELAVPQIRDAVIATARERCEARYHAAFDKIAAQLDDRGMKLIRQPKVPLDAVQAIQQVLNDARHAIVERIGNVAIDRAKQVIARADPDAAARIDVPVTRRATPRDVAILRACDARVPKVPAAIVQSLLDSVTELSQLAWRSPERPVRTYAPTQTFAVGDVLDHPKFGRGSVMASVAQRIEVEFADGRHTLVHGK